MKGTWTLSVFDANADTPDPPVTSILNSWKLGITPVKPFK